MAAGTRLALSPGPSFPPFSGAGTPGGRPCIRTTMSSPRLGGRALQARPPGPGGPTVWGSLGGTWDWSRTEAGPQSEGDSGSRWAPPPFSPPACQPICSLHRALEGAAWHTQLCSAPPRAERIPRVHPASPAGGHATEGLSGGRLTGRPSCIQLGQRPLFRAGLSPASGPPARPVCPLGSGAGLLDNKCLFSRAGAGGGQDVTAFPSCPVRQWFSQSGHR